MPDLVREPSTGSSVRRPSFFQSTSADLLITVTREGRQFVWSPACLAWLRMEQPLINASTVNVLVSGPVSVTGQVSVLGNVSVTPARVGLAASPATRASVGTLSTLVVQNRARTGLVLSNTSSVGMYFGVSGAASLGAGIFLAPNGVWEMDEWTFSSACINAIVSVAGVASVAIQEWL